jgi:hypothetical protein
LAGACIKPPLRDFQDGPRLFVILGAKEDDWAVTGVQTKDAAGGTLPERQ